MIPKVLAILTWLAIAAPAPSAGVQDAWLKGLEGTWVVDEARDADADIVLTIVREKNHLVLKAAVGGGVVVTRYDVSGADLTNANFGRKATPGGPAFNRTVLRRKMPR